MSDEELRALRGAVRDGVGSIENLATVLSSRRVGPRVIVKALPEVRAGCGGLATALGRLADALAGWLGDDADGMAAASEMLGHAALRVNELGADLDRLGADATLAKSRLALEAVVRRVGGELAGVLRLLDLLSSAANARATALDLGDLLATGRTFASGTPPVLALVDVGSVPSITADARLVAELVGFVVGALARGGVVEPAIVARTSEEGRAVLEIGRPAGPLSRTAKQLPMEIPIRAALPRELDVIRAAAKRGGIRLVTSDDGHRVDLTF